MKNLLQEMLSGYLKSSEKYSQSYIDKIRQKKNSAEMNWDERALKSARSIITAVCFKETSVSLLERTDNLIYPPIGFYYSIFHLSLGLLKLDYSTDLDQLSHIQHKKLEKMIRSKLVSTKILTDDYINCLIKLRELRESCNYRFGADDGWLFEHLKTADKLTESCFDEGLTFIHRVLQETDMRSRFQTGIGDSFGDDIIDTYLSGEEREKIWDYLVLNCLTT